MSTPIEILKTKFGYSDFRLEQENIINNILSKKDTFVLMPTGGGKSICYQIPALIFDGLTIVISPLIALMKDQVDALRLNGVEAAFLNSSLSDSQQSDVIEKIKQKKLKLLYIAPERFFGKDQQFLGFLKTITVSLFAIDEAHCISSWGHDFRPEYLMLSKLKKEFKNVPIIALTATADKHTKQDILEKLNLHDPKIFISSFNRANIHYFVEPKKDTYSKLVKFIKSKPDESGIIYALSRKSVEELSSKLQDEGFSVKPYHAGLDKSVKDENQELFIKDKVKIMVATIAFGMGIDKSNVRYVIHVDLPKNIEGYYQETGRAGRDGLKSEALLFYSGGDVMKLKSFVEIDGNAQQSKILLRKLEKMAELCEIKTCRRKYILNYFGEEHPEICGTCDACLSEYEREDATIIAQKALSAVYRLNERFGISYVVDFLRGSKSEKMRYEHMDLKTYGIGADIRKEDWSRYIKELIHAGYLKQDGDVYPVLKLTSTSGKVLKGEEKVFLTKITSRQEAKEAVVLDYEKNLFAQLKVLRNKLADKENVPAYIIFSDATLIELATYLPLSISDLKLISGFGEIKTEKYGDLFLKEIVTYCKAKNLNTRIENKAPKRKRGGNSTSSSITGDTKQESLQLYRSGKTITEIAAARNLSPITIETHLAHFITVGEIEVTELVEPDKIPAIEAAIKLHGDLKLAPLKEELGDDFSYSEIKAVVNFLKKS